MASARKQEHLEAGKRRLEEFRKKKAAERAKKSANHLHTVNADGHDKQPIDYQHEILTDSNGAVTSDRVSEAVLEPSRGVFDEENKTTYFVQTNEIVSNDIHSNPTYYNTFSTEIAQAPTENKDFDRHHGLWSSRIVDADYPPYSQEKNDYSITAGVSGRHGYGFASDQSVSFSPQDDGNSTQPSHDGSHESYLKDTDGQLKDYRPASLATSRLMVANFSPENSGGIQLLNNSSYGSLLDSGLTLSSNEGERKRSDSVGLFPSGNSTTFWSSESKSTASTTGPSSDYPPFYQAVAETNSRRSRPSFLDSIDLPRIPRTEPGRVDSISSKVQDVNVVSSSAFGSSHSETERVQPFSRPEASNEPSAFEHSMFSSFPAGNGNEMFRDVTNNHSKERESGFYLQKQDEDFAALEQHIEDLTQEKFSLQRALEASRTLADSLAAENSSLTDSYNQQGSTVNQLKSDMERLQEEIKAQLVELESVKMEYANAQLECTAADERAKLLASEVISLEEKALRLRSSELKLERQLENSQAEFSSFKKKLSSLEKDRQDLQSTIDALREEKKLLQAKLRKASANTKFVDAGKSLNNQKHVSTSTEDLFHEDDSDAAAGTSNLETHSDAILLGTNSSFSSLLSENGQFNLEVLSSSIPSDQLRMIQNINTLVSELALEKEELMQALLAESLESSKLKESNKELSRKLEVQTQRLELLAAQNMANENFPIRQPDPRGMPDNTPYADEGDEVVERVLGWIMKLFPGGPSRRRTSKLI